MPLLRRLQLLNIINKETGNIFPADLVHIIIEYVNSMAIENLLAPKWKNNQAFVSIPIFTIRFGSYMMGEDDYFFDCISMCGHMNDHLSKKPIPLNKYNDMLKNNIIIILQKDNYLESNYIRTGYINAKCTECELYTSFPCNIYYCNNYKTIIIKSEILTEHKLYIY